MEDEDDIPDVKTLESVTESDILDNVKNKNNITMDSDEDANEHDAEINKPSMMKC